MFSPKATHRLPERHKRVTSADDVRRRSPEGVHIRVGVRINIAGLKTNRNPLGPWKKGQRASHSNGERAARADGRRELANRRRRRPGQCLDEHRLAGRQTPKPAATGPRGRLLHTLGVPTDR